MDKSRYASGLHDLIRGCNKCQAADPSIILGFSSITIIGISI